VERIIVENALAAKYGLLHEIANRYIINDTTTFVHDVAGIGNLGGITHDIAKGASPLTVSSPSDLNEGEFLFWGENGLDGKETIDVETGVIDNRWEKVWQFFEGDDVGTVTLTFYKPLTTGLYDDVKLLIDENGIFNSGTISPIDATSYDETQGTITFENIDINDGWFYTLGSVDARTPLPVTLTGYSLTEENGTVSIDWTVATEINNEGFEIQKSQDGKRWEVLGFVPGAGNTSFPTQYALDDSQPHVPVSYYKCVQRDFDGTEEIIFVDRIDIDGNQIDQDHIVYPNPITSGEINVLIGSGRPKKISLHSPNGQPINYRVLEETEQRIKLKLDQTGYPFFVLSIMNLDGSVERRIILSDKRN